MSKNTAPENDQVCSGTSAVSGHSGLNQTVTAVLPADPENSELSPLELPVSGHSEAIAESHSDWTAKRAALMEAGKRFRQDFFDGPQWRELASQRGIRLPGWYYPCEPRYMRRYLRKLGVPVQQYLEQSGERTLSDFSRNNPDWPLWAWVGLVLEDLAEQETGTNPDISDSPDSPDSPDNLDATEAAADAT